MKNSRFGIRKDPFEVSTSARPSFASADHSEVYNGFFLALLARKRLMALYGETGVGKTTLLNALLDHLEAEGGMVLAATATSGMGVEDLIMAARTQLDGLARPDANEGETLEQLVEQLERRLEDAGHGVLVVDDAHRLDLPAIADLFELARTDTETGRYLQVLLSGEPVLERMLAEPDLAAAMKAFGVAYHLGPLDRSHTETFVRERLRAAGARRDELFDGPALDKVHEYSGGLPGVISTICGQCLRMAEEKREERIGVARVEAAARSLGIELPDAREDEPEIPTEIQEPAPRRGIETAFGVPIEAMPRFEPRPAEPPTQPAYPNQLRAGSADAAGTAQAVPRPAPQQEVRNHGGAAPLSTGMAPAGSGPAAVLRPATPHGRPAPYAVPERRRAGAGRWAAMALLAVLLGAGAGLALSDSRPLDRLYEAAFGEAPPWEGSTAARSSAGIDPSSAPTTVPVRAAPPPVPPEAPASEGEIRAPEPAPPAVDLTASAQPPAPMGANRPDLSSPTAPAPAQAVPPGAQQAPSAQPAPPPAAPGQPEQVAAMPPPEPPATASRAEIAELLTQAERWLQARYLTTPAGSNAFETYRRIVAIDPGNPEAAQVLARIKAMYLNWGTTAEQRADIESARRHFERGLSVDPADQTFRERLDALDRRTRTEAQAEPSQAEPDQAVAALTPVPSSDQVLRLPPGYREPAAPGQAVPANPQTATPAAQQPPAPVAPNAFDNREAILAAIDRPEVLRGVIRDGRRLDVEMPDGKTPLMLAAERGRTESLRLLLQAGAGANARSRTGQTALMLAASAGDPGSVRALLDSGAAVNAQSVDGRTALMVAAERGQLDIVRQLLDNGADIDATTTGGRSALSYATQAGHEDVAMLLRLRGARAGAGTSRAAPIDLGTFRRN
ncbi:ankyrin repeat domain-containing protein [Arenibaculum pallidiluteum]|uniref:ankyrin repeat domain-containing protein n=1 Tax=Arenibaculum pallidiluteum TaxID=2812559 RepID=UPI001A96EA94|nr:ankyrin repeat domain-containing protein [Arenibaculum pallidiluteum]